MRVAKISERANVAGPDHAWGDAFLFQVVRKGAAAMPPARARCSRSARRAVAAAVPLAMLLSVVHPSTAAGRSLTVRPDGTGDLPTIQEAIDSLARSRPPYPYEVPDTVHATAGTHEAPVDFRKARALVLLGEANGGQTSLRSATFDADDSDGQCCYGVMIRRVTFLSPILRRGYRDEFECRDCIFEGAVTLIGNGWNRIVACEFRAPVAIRSYTAIDSCRFVQATLLVQSGDANPHLRDCAFLGPGDQAATVVVSDDHAVVFERCQFGGLKRGLVITGLGTELIVKDCTFGDIVDYAIGMDGGCRPEGVITVKGSQFIDCGKAVQLRGGPCVAITIAQTRVTGTHDTAIDVTAHKLTMTDSAILGAGGDGVRCTLWNHVGYHSQFPGRLEVSGLTVHGSRGRGVVVERAEDAMTPKLTFTDCTIADNASDGVVLRGQFDRVSGNVVSRNRGSGMLLTHESPDGPLLVTQNTAAGNGGTGLRLELRPVEAGSLADARIEANLCIANGGEGLVVPPSLAPHVRHNDAWRNVGSDFVGAEQATDNLTLDPQFCDPLVGNFHVTASSPCAPSGPYGQIGALGVGCDRMSVAVDARPRSERDQVNLGSQGLLQVGIFGSRYFDVARINSPTVRLADAVPALPGRSDHRRLDADLDGDDYPDRLLSFRSDDLMLEPGGQEALLEGATFDGVTFVGRVALDQVLHGNGIARSKREARQSAAVLASTVRYAAPAILSVKLEVQRVRVRVGLPNAEVASLELFDVSGRRLARQYGQFGAGEHDINLLPISCLVPGVYWIRLRQGTESAVHRTVAVR